MLDVNLKYPNGEVLATVADTESGNSTTIRGSNAVEVFQQILAWADLDIIINEETRTTQIPVDEGFLQDLQGDSDFLGKLYAAGVENWEGFDEAKDM